MAETDDAVTVPSLALVPCTVTGSKPFLTGPAQAPAAYEAGWKDAMIALPAKVTTFVAKWDAGYKAATTPGTATAPGAGNGAATPKDASTWTFADVTEGPYVWHCHINSHEDSEMMRTSLVLP